VKMIYAGAIFLFFLHNVCTSNLDQARALFKEHEYQKAAEIYQTIEPKNGVIWYNLGHCYAQQHDQYNALLCWRTAQKTAYAHHYLLLQNYIDQAEQDLGITHLQTQFKRLTHGAKNYSLAVPLVVWQVIFLFLWYLVLCFLLLRKRLKSVISVLLIVCLGCSGGVLLMHYDATTARVAVINDNEVLLYAGTDTRFSHKMVMAKGQPVTIKHSDAAWHKVECNNSSGWVCADKLQEITT